MYFRSERYDDSIIKKSLHLLKKRKLFPELYSYRSIAREVGVKSHKTIARWDRVPMDLKSRRERQAKKGHNRLFSVDTEKVIAGWILFRNRNFSPCRSLDLSYFVRKHFNVVVNASWRTRFYQRQHLALRCNSTMKKREVEQGCVEEIAEFITKIRSLGKRPEQVFWL